MTDHINVSVCIEHGRFAPCRHGDAHRYTDNPHWVKQVMDWQHSPYNFPWLPVRENEMGYDIPLIRDGGRND